jgi:hypothetical protein
MNNEDWRITRATILRDGQDMEVVFKNVNGNSQFAAQCSCETWKRALHAEWQFMKLSEMLADITQRVGGMFVCFDKKALAEAEKLEEN